MRVLIVALSNRGGGASRAVDALAKSLMNKKIDVEVLLFEGDKEIYSPTFLLHNKVEKFQFLIKNKISRMFMALFPNPSQDYRSINIFPSKLLSVINSSDADIVNIHWMGAEMLQIEQMPGINKPSVWTIHDAWMIGGVYHVPPCDCFPFIKDSGDNILDRWVYKRKKKAYSKMQLHLISPSYFLKQKFENSPFSGYGNTCSVIRNLIDSSIWYPRDSKNCKEKLGFPDSKINVLFVANNLLSSSRKGYNYVKLLIDNNSDDYLFHFVGTDQTMLYDNVVVHGRISSQEQLADYYSASDICLVPSIWENMPYVAVESLMCGTPVLCFDNSGMSEIVKTGVNGYAAKKFDEKDLLNGLKYLTNHRFDIPVEKSVADFLPEININRYINEYNKIIQSWRNQD